MVFCFLWNEIECQFIRQTLAFSGQLGIIAGHINRQCFSGLGQKLGLEINGISSL